MSSYATTVSDVPAIAAPVEVTREPLAAAYAEIDGKALARFLDLAATFRKGFNSCLPILGTVKIDIHPLGVTATVIENTVTDNYMTQTFPGVACGESSACIEIKALSALVKGSTGDVRIEFSPGGRAAIGRDMVGTMFAEDYPATPAVERVASCELRTGSFTPLLASISKDPHRAILNGVLTIAENGTVTLVSTDTHRLTVRTTDTETPEALKVVLPACVARVACKIKAPVTLTIDGEGHYDAAIGDVHILGCGLSGTYPNWERVVPQNNTLEATGGHRQSNPRRQAKREPHQVQIHGRRRD